MVRVLVADSFDSTVLDRLAGVPSFSVVYQPHSEDRGFLQEVPFCQALLIRGRPLPAAVLEQAPLLKIIVRAGNGVDHIDMESAARLGIEVRNTPEATADSVAEYTIGLLLAAARFIGPAYRNMKAGGWDRSRYLNGTEIAGKTIGIVGFGRIGSRVARRALGLEMRVVYTDIRPIQTQLDVLSLSLQELLTVSDIVSLHVPLDSGTRGLIGAAELAAMKPSTILINAARGGVVDERALLAALQADRLQAAAFDVFFQEPPVDRELIDHPRMIPLPHLGGATIEGRERINDQVIGCLREYFHA